MIISPQVLSAASMAFLSLSFCRGFSSLAFTSSLVTTRQFNACSARVFTQSHFRRPISRIIPCYFDPTTMSEVNNRRPKSPGKLFSSSGDTYIGTKTDTSSSRDDENSGVPMTLLAGFLGSGKTTTLQNLLTNNDGLKIGIIVNDVASINIDNKLLANPNFSSEDTETIELQNGCACCSLADELLDSVAQLMTQSGGKKRDLDAIVVELSGVADPVAVKKNWEQAEAIAHPATRFARMDKVVTLVDSSTFGTDWMTWDTSFDREGWTDENTHAPKNVPELLAEQVEAADVLVINKIDLAGEEQVKVATGLVRNLNEKAGLHEVQFGEISVKEVLDAGKVSKEECTDPTHDHSHSHKHGAEEVAEKSHDHSDGHSHSHGHVEEELVNEKHEHSNGHSHSHDHGAEQAVDDGHSHDVECTDPSHSHSHDSKSHDHEAECTDPSHSHSHSHDHDDGEACTDPNCTDTGHSHTHSHDHQSTHADNLGITNFVYKSDRPFNPSRLLGVLNNWPVPVKEELDLGELAEASQDGYDVDGEEEENRSPFVGVLRSKGFCWMSPTKWIGVNEDVWRHNTAMYWSHAGKHFGISTAGKWWATISKDKMKAIFVSNEKEYNRIIEEDFVTDEFGDRRQEIVFIGANIDEDEITKVLDECLCTDDEMEVYRQQLLNFEESRYTVGARKVKSVVPEGVKAVSPDNE